MSGAKVIGQKVWLLRMSVFRLWFLTLVIIIGCFVYAKAGNVLPLDNSELLKSASLILAIITAPLGVIINFYKRADEIQVRAASLRPEWVEITALSSGLYHLDFWGL